MSGAQTGNDLNDARARFCLALEQFRRTPEGRVRDSKDFQQYFCAFDERGCVDRVLRFMPNEVRGPVLAEWGIRGRKAALRDTDERVQTVLHESLLAGDLDHATFETGLSPELLARWVPLPDYWRFWRAGKLARGALRKALETGNELGLFDAGWFLDTIEGANRRTRGVETLAEGLSKPELTAWLARVYESRDGSAKGMLAALGWETVAAKTAEAALIAVLDALARKIALDEPAAAASPAATTESGSGATPAGGVPGSNAAELAGGSDDGAEASGGTPATSGPPSLPAIEMGAEEQGYSALAALGDKFLTDADLEPTTGVIATPMGVESAFADAPAPVPPPPPTDGRTTGKPPRK